MKLFTMFKKGLLVEVSKKHIERRLKNDKAYKRERVKVACKRTNYITPTSAVNWSI